MIGKLNHVAIVVPDLQKGADLYRDVLGAQVSEPMPLPEHGVTTVFVELENTKIELLHPLGGASPVSRYLERHPQGGVHHICYEVADITVAEISCARLVHGYWAKVNRASEHTESQYCFYTRPTFVER